MIALALDARTDRFFRHIRRLDENHSGITEPAVALVTLLIFISVATQAERARRGDR